MLKFFKKNPKKFFLKRKFFSSKPRVYDPYKLLGVERGDEFSKIKKQYFALVKEFHPDRNPEKNTEEEFKRIQECFERIKEDRGMKVRMKFRDENEEDLDNFQSVRPDQRDYE
mgnify:CR=1 FL=1